MDHWGNPSLLLKKDQGLSARHHAHLELSHILFLSEADHASVQVALGAAQDGHAFPVACLQIVGTFLFSADFKGNIKV